MVTVAVAGGTGSVGKTIVDAIVKAGKHKVVVLTRTVCSRLSILSGGNYRAVSDNRSQVRMALEVRQNASSTTAMSSR